MSSTGSRGSLRAAISRTPSTWRTRSRQAGLSTEHPRTGALLSLYQRLYGLPRHLGQHSGGMIICEGQLDSIMPLENASMPGRVVAQWDKDDCEDLGIIKVDLLGLGMMSVLQDTIELCRVRGASVDLATIPKDDPATFDAMCPRRHHRRLPDRMPRADGDPAPDAAPLLLRRGHRGRHHPARTDPGQHGPSVPGAARGQGEAHLFRRAGTAQARAGTHPGRAALPGTMLKMAMVMADFSGSEAEELRRALSFHRSPERMEKVEVKLRARHGRARAFPPTVIEEIVKATKSFALYGFPESHALSFALLAYGSAWLKVHRAPEFFASLLNNQPMGFYSSATLVKDARRHGIKTRPVCVLRSEWACTIEAPDDAVRLGFCVVNGLNRDRAEALLQTRRRQPFRSRQDFLARAGARTATNSARWRVSAR